MISRIIREVGFEVPLDLDMMFLKEILKSLNLVVTLNCEFLGNSLFLTDINVKGEKMYPLVVSLNQKRELNFQEFSYPPFEKEYISQILKWISRYIGILI